MEYMDSGWAWAVLVACFFNNMLNDGLMSSLGVFLVVWQDHFPGSITQISWIISLVGGVMYAVGPIGSALCKTFSIRQVVMASTILSSSSLIAASFATNLWHLYVTFTLAGIGLGLTYQPSLVILAYYFDNRLARANGVAGAGVAVGLMVDATGRYDIPFYVASVCYLLCSLFIFAYPLMHHLRHRDHKATRSQRNDLHGQEHPVELEKKTKIVTVS